MNSSHQMLSSLMQVYMSQPPKMNQNIDRRRIEVLLQINTVLLYKCIALQQYVMNQQNIYNSDYNNKKELYQNYLKRIHYNLTCLASINDIYSNTPGPKKNYTLPQIIYPPPECTELFEHYKLLNQLYPEAMPFFQKKMSLLRQQMQSQNSTRGTTASATTPIDQHQILRQRVMQQQQQQQQNLQQTPGFSQPQNSSLSNTPLGNELDLATANIQNGGNDSIGSGTPNFSLGNFPAPLQNPGVDSTGIDFTF